MWFAPLGCRPRPSRTVSRKTGLFSPFLGMIFGSAQDPESTAFVVYSLIRHRVVIRVPLPGPSARVEMFLFNEDFIVGTTTPLPAFRIPSSATFSLMTSILHVSLTPYTTP